MGLAVTLTPGAQRSAERRGLLLGFGAFGGMWGAWSAVLPDVRDRVGFDDGQLGLALGVVALAALPVMLASGRLIDTRGARVVLPAALAAFGVVAVLLGLPTSPALLVVALIGLGVTTGFLDVALNTATAAWERLEADRLMAAAHGCFSVGVLTGSVLTGVSRDLGAGPTEVLGAAGVLALLAAARQPRYRDVAGVPGRQGPVRRMRLGPVLVGLGVVAGLSFLVEDALQSWSALHLERSLDAAPVVGGLGPGLFAGAMAVGRFAVHAAHRPGQEHRVVAGGASLLTAGILVFALAPVTWLALVGVAVAGLGVSVLAPTLLSAVGARSAPGRQGGDLALVAALGYVGFVTGPVVVGVLSDATTLPTALALLAVLGAAAAVAGPVLLRRRVAPEPAPA